MREVGGGGGGTAEETKAHNLALSQVSDKTKPFTQLKYLANSQTLIKEEARNKRAAPVR